MVNLRTLSMAHRAERKSSERIEDYIEVIYELIRQKGYARTVDIAANLHTKPPSVTKMLQRLHEEGLIVYEKHRGIAMTKPGEVLAKSVIKKHETLTTFLRALGVDEGIANKDVEGFEHHVSQKTIDRIGKFMDLLKRNPSLLEGMGD